MSRVIVTKTDHDFVRLSIKRLGKILAGVAVAATTALAAPAQAATLTRAGWHGRVIGWTVNRVRP